MKDLNLPESNAISLRKHYVKRYSIVGILFLLLILAGVYLDAASYNQPIFVGQNSTFNVSLPGSNQNVTEYIEIPMYGYVQNFTITLRGG